MSLRAVIVYICAVMGPSLSFGGFLLFYTAWRRKRRGVIVTMKWDLTTLVFMAVGIILSVISMLIGLTKLTSGG